MKKQTSVFVGVVEHRYGTNFYASKTWAGLRRQVAEYCREYWSAVRNTVGKIPPEDDPLCIELYFEAHKDESFLCEETQLGE